MGISTILRLLPQDGDGDSGTNGSRAFYFRDFLREYASSVAIGDDCGVVNNDDELPEELSHMIIAPLSTCRVLVEKQKRNGCGSRNNNKNKNNRYNNYNHKHHHKNYHHHNIPRSSRCHQSVRSIVDDVVYSLVQNREKLRCQRNHERRHSFKRRRKRRNNNSNSNSSNNNIRNVPFCGANALVHGFGVSREGDPVPPTGMKSGISYQHPNENVTFCKSSLVIKRLHELVGDEVVRMILMHTRCFLPIIRRESNNINSNSARSNSNNNSTRSSKNNSNDNHSDQSRKRKRGNGSMCSADTDTDTEHDEDSYNYILLCGPPLIFDSNRFRTMVGFSSNDGSTSEAGEDDWKHNSNSKTKTKKKKRKRSFPTSLADDSPLSANESISRFSLLYSDSYVPRVGLPKSHPFPQRRLEHQHQQQNNNKTSKSMDDFNFMLNIIFELHLDNKNKQRRMRKRLGGIGRLVCERLWKMYSSHHDYSRVLTKYCPLLEVYNEVTTASTLNASKNDDYLAKLAHAYTSKEGIFSFLASVLRSVFPSEFWGSEANFRSFLASVRSFLNLRRQEKMANKTIMHGISVTSMKWLYPALRCPNNTNSSSSSSSFSDSRRPSPELDKNTDTAHECKLLNHPNKNGRRKKRKPGKQRTNHEAATELTLQAFRWVFKGFIIPLLRSCFYVTETEFAARELHYYRKPIWSLFRALSLQKITTTAAPGGATATPDQHHQQINTNRNHFRILPHSRALQCLRKQTMGISKLRFLPKTTGMRPIAQLSRSARFEFPVDNTTRKAEAKAPPLPNVLAAKTNKNLSVHPKRVRTEHHPSREDSRPGKKQKMGDPLSMEGLVSKETSKSNLSSISLSQPQPQLQPQQRHVSFSRLPTNTMLENVLDVLTYECRQKHRPYGNGLGNLQEFYVRYREYMARFRKPKYGNKKDACDNNSNTNNEPRKLFFAKVDIEKCYDRIHQDYMLGLVQDMVLHNSYVVQIIKMKCANPKTRKAVPGQADVAETGDNAFRLKKVVETIEDYQSFHHQEHPMAKERQHTVFEILKCSLVDKSKTLELLREHLLQHVVVAMGRHKPKLLLQTRGISQGSTLSMLLCNLYYGRVEKLMNICGERNSNQAFAPEDDNESNLMSRFVDDFLFVSPNKDSFQEFLDKTHMGNPELGAKINPNKTLVNAEASVNISSGEGETKNVVLSRSHTIMNNGRRVFPWCGLLFDTISGEVLVDYERFRGGKLRRSLTIDADGREGEHLAQRLRAFLFPRCLPILYDNSINSFATTVVNFYQMMLFGACKTKEYLLGLNTLMKRPPYYIHNVSFLLKCISGLSGFATKNIRSKSRHCMVDRDAEKVYSAFNPNNAIRVDPAIAFALSLQAYCDVFSYSSGFHRMARLLKEKFSASSECIPNKKRDELRKITARAFDDFRINALIEK